MAKYNRGNFRLKDSFISKNNNNLCKILENAKKFLNDVALCIVYYILWYHIVEIIFNETAWYIQ